MRLVEVRQQSIFFGGGGPRVKGASNRTYLTHTKTFLSIYLFLKTTIGPTWYLLVTYLVVTNKSWSYLLWPPLVGATTINSVYRGTASVSSRSSVQEPVRYELKCHKPLPLIVSRAFSLVLLYRGRLMPMI